MPITAKVSFFYRTNDDEGWSESFYFDATDITTAQAAADTGVSPRMALSGPNVNMIYARVSDVLIKGDSLQLTGPFPQPGTYTPDDPDEQPLIANAALMIRWVATSLIKGRTFLRGLPSEVLLGREYAPTTSFTTALNAWQAWVVGTGLTQGKVRHRTSVGPPPTYTYTVIDHAEI